MVVEILLLLVRQSHEEPRIVARGEDDAHHPKSLKAPR